MNLPLAPFTAKPGFYTTLTNKQYHGAAGLSSSKAKKFLQETPQRIMWDEVHKEFKHNPVCAQGTAYHTKILEPENFDRDIAVSPFWDARTKEGKAAKAAFLQANEGKTIIDEIAYENVIGMATATLAHPTASQLLDGSLNETSIFWECEDFATEQTVLLKVRPDALGVDAFGKPVIIDLKTTSDASWSSMQRDILKYGYHISAAMYLRGVNQCKPVLDMFKQEFSAFVLVCVESEPPYQVACYEIGEDFIQKGNAALDVAINRYCDALQQDFPGYPTTLRVINAPPWADRLNYL